MTHTPPTGMVFDIQRCSLHDGPGIRTTVFLKGCPLRCRWCHNPEAVAPQPQLAFLSDRCTRCGACAQACPHQAHTLLTDSHTLDRARCQACGTCPANCPNGALRLIGARLTVEAVMAEVAADMAFYARSGGGITLSGGEPLAQLTFSRAVLEASRAQGIHTCVETCGHAPASHLISLLPLVDLFLFDYKATDPRLHRSLTGVSNQLILRNLTALLDAGAGVILRCPLIPGVNDHLDHLAAIARFSQRSPGPKAVEIMPYHAMGREKARHIGQIPALAEIPTADEQTRQGWQQSLLDLGCQNLIPI